MEALVAVGLAGNVVQFVQFAGKLISETISIRNSGTPSSLANLKNLSDTLTRQAGVIKTRLKASNATLAQEDQYLLDIATQCEQNGTRFTAYLDDLMKQIASPNPLRSAKKTIQRIWSQHRIEEFVFTIEELRSTLTLATILAFKSSVSGNNVEILAHLRAIEADDKNQDINRSEILENIQLVADIVQGQVGQQLDTIQEHIRRCLNEINVLRHEIPTTREEQILEWLNFRQMAWRYEEIDPAYRRTYEWVFQKPPEVHGWDDFEAHLLGDASEPYFINGKAGSGKSTLMKFIVSHRRTNEALQRWAGEQDLLVLQFFFWNLGTTLQKSNEGMLRALLHQVLERYPELIPAVLPKVHHAWKDSDADSAPDYIEVKRAFLLMIEKAKFLRLCIFIDGVDELEGDHRDMSRFLRSWTCSQIKLIVSSRPINPCLNTLQGCPGLRLQDLTRGDMELFVEGELASHQLMIGMARLFPQEAHDLSIRIRNKAEGVFLWVKLVVRLLVHGLEDGDDMKDLQNKLQLLPSDLRDLYRRMISKMQPDHQIQAAEMFQLFHTWNTIMAEQPLRALVLSYGTHKPSDAFDLEISPVNSETFNWLAQQIELRIRSRCCGLLELRERPGWDSKIDAKFYMSVAEIAGPVVSYLHRTVAEFLTSDDVWKEICAITKESGFDPILGLASACLSMTKVAQDLSDPALPLHVEYTSAICRRAADMSDWFVGRYITCLDETMREHSNRLREKGSEYVNTTRNVHWSAEWFSVLENSQWQSELHRLASNFTFAARKGLIQYLKAYSVGSGSQSRYAMVVYAVEDWRQAALQSQRAVTEHAPTLQERMETLNYLLQNMATPEDHLLGISLWHHAVLIGRKLSDARRKVDAAELLRIFLRNAKSPMELVNLPIQNDVWTIHPRYVIQELVSSVNFANSSLGDELAHLMSSATNTSQGFVHAVTEPASSNGILYRDALNEARYRFVHAVTEPASSNGMLYRDALDEARYLGTPTKIPVHPPSVAGDIYHDTTRDSIPSEEQWTWEEISSQLGVMNLHRPPQVRDDWQRISAIAPPSQPGLSSRPFNIVPPTLSPGYVPFGVYGRPNSNINFPRTPHFPIPGCHITIHTDATNNKDARLLLQAVGLPFYGKLND